MHDNTSAILTTSQIAFAFKPRPRELSPSEQRQRQRDLYRRAQLERLVRWIEDYENGHGVIQ
jgi:hypothetical protein